MKISQFSHRVAQPKDTTHKDSLFIKSLGFNSGERSEIEDTVELLWEQVETLKQLLYDKELELQEIQQELLHTNEDLYAALNSPLLALNEVKELVEEILVSENSTGEALTTLFNTIYNSTVKPSELKHKEKSNSIKPVRSAPDNSIFINNEAYKTKMAVVIKQAREIRAKSQMLREQSREVQAHSKKVKAHFIELGIKFVGFQASFMLREPNFRHKQQPKVIELAD